MELKLSLPSLGFESAFVEFYEDYVQNDVENAERYRDGILDFSAYIQRLQDESKGLNLRDDYVPSEHFWLIGNNKNILGTIRVRHNINNNFLSLEGGHIGYDIAPSYRGLGYGKKILKLVLPKAKSLGIQQALITADEDNIASRKVIEANGGKFDKIVMGKVFSNPLARYWIDCQ